MTESTLSFSHSLAYICEKVPVPISLEAKKELYDVVEVAAQSSKPTIRQLFNGLVAVRMVSNGQMVTASDISLQMGLLISLSKLSYMIPKGPLLNQEKMLNSIVRMLKDEIHEQDDASFDINLDGYRYADPWKLGLCALYMTQIVSSATDEWAEFANIAFRNIHNIYLAALRLSEKDHGWLITLVLALISNVDLAVHISKIPKKTEAQERNMDFLLNSALHSLFGVIERIYSDDSDLNIYLGLIAVEATQKIFVHQDSVWMDLSDSRQMEWVQSISKTILKLAELYLNNSELWLLISRLFLILMTADGFRILMNLPDTTLCLLQLAMDRIAIASSRFERQTWLPFVFKFCMYILSKKPNVSYDLSKLDWIESSSDDQVDRLESLFLDIYTHNYNKWYEAICNVLSTSINNYLN